jgi:DNA mismatch endonuclease (patch repair protein)
MRRRANAGNGCSMPGIAAEPAVSETRRRIMRAVRSENTGPERRVRSLLSRLGYRYRLHRKGLPGKPDIVLASRRKAIFIHGCFWHQHPGCRKAGIPKSRRSYWLPKLRGNSRRDSDAVNALNALGWNTLVVWQCELANEGALTESLCKFLGPPGGAP